MFPFISRLSLFRNYRIQDLPYHKEFPCTRFSIFQDFPDLIQGFSIFLPPGHRLPTWSVAFFYCPRVLAKCVFTSKMNKWHFSNQLRLLWCSLHGSWRALLINRTHETVIDKRMIILCKIYERYKIVNLEIPISCKIKPLVFGIHV